MFIVKCNAGYVADHGSYGVSLVSKEQASRFVTEADAKNSIDGIRPAAEYGDFVIVADSPRV